MRLSASLINGQRGDAGLLVRVEGRRGLLLFDCGETRRLPHGDLIDVADVALSHGHMDHLIGFDHLLRVNLPFPRTIRVFGPPGITEVIGARLAGYTWNKVGGLFVEIEVAEPWVGEARPDSAQPADEGRLAAIEAADRHRVTRFRCQRQFVPEPQGLVPARPGVVFAEPDLELHFAPLHHGIVSLAFALVVPARLRVDKAVLAALGRPPGPWVGALKAEAEARLARGEGLPPDLPPGLLVHEPARRHLVYATDFAYTPANVERLTRLARGAELFYCEAVFLERDAEMAREASHLTARQAGTIAARAGVRRVIPFHFSRRYQREYDRLAAEVEAAFAAGQPA